MRETVLRKASAPSAILLKFLRAQKDGVPFFAFSTSVFPSLHHACRRSKPASINRLSQRAIATCTPEYLPIGSSFFSLETIWPGRNEQQTQGSSQSQEHTASKSWNYGHSLGQSRSVSTNSPSENGKGFWGFRRKRPKAPLQQNDLPSLSGFLDDDSSLGRPLRPANELRLRCTEFNESGNITLANGEFKKSELIAKVGSA